MTIRPVVVLFREDVPFERLDAYLESIRAAGGEAVAASPDTDPRAPDRMHDFSGIVLTGGVDVDPVIYLADRHEKTKFTDPVRDGFELRFISAAIERDLPVLAICRGSQLLNVAMGGTLHQHIEDYSHVAERGTGVSRFHDVVFAEDSRLRAIFGGAERIRVNSRHHQAVTPDRLAEGLLAAGRTDDGYVEAIESVNHRFIVGVQWHPEREEIREESLPLFRAFVEATREGR